MISKIHQKWQFLFQNSLKMALRGFEKEKIATSLRLIA